MWDGCLWEMFPSRQFVLGIWNLYHVLKGHCISAGFPTDTVPFVLGCFPEGPHYCRLCISGGGLSCCWSCIGISGRCWNCSTEWTRGQMHPRSSEWVGGWFGDAFLGWKRFHLSWSPFYCTIYKVPRQYSPGSPFLLARNPKYCQPAEVVFFLGTRSLGARLAIFLPLSPPCFHMMTSRS